jgi:hypothetical protein
MEYVTEIRAAQDDARRLEELYQAARRDKETDEFAAALLAFYQESPDSVLYAAWYYRLQQTPVEEPVGRSINWKLAVPLSALTGLIFWLLSGPRFEFSDQLPYIMVFWAPIAAFSVVAFLALTASENKKAAWLTIAGLAGVGLYVALLTTLRQRQHYRDLMALHLPLSAWIAAGLSVLWRRPDHQNRFAFLIKSVEVFITAGLYAMAGGAFIGITIGLFDALRIYLSEEVMRLLIAGGGGLIPLLAVVGAYDPFASPIGQKFEQGLSRLISTLMRLLLPLTLLVLVIYLAVIPFNFMEPFNNRDVLIVYNAMLFAVMLLLIGATPVRANELAAKHQSVLRAGIVAVAVLTVLVSLYALSATVYRTVLGGITMNRLTIIGWNSINIGILILLVYKQIKDGPAQWVRSLQAVFSRGTVAYIGWTLFLIAAIPWLFRE